MKLKKTTISLAGIFCFLLSMFGLAEANMANGGSGDNRIDTIIINNTTPYTYSVRFMWKNQSGAFDVEKEEYNIAFQEELIVRGMAGGTFQESLDLDELALIVLSAEDLEMRNSIRNRYFSYDQNKKSQSDFYMITSGKEKKKELIIKMKIHGKVLELEISIHGRK